MPREDRASGWARGWKGESQEPYACTEKSYCEESLTSQMGNIDKAITCKALLSLKRNPFQNVQKMLYILSSMA